MLFTMIECNFYERFSVGCHWGDVGVSAARQK